MLVLIGIAALSVVLGLIRPVIGIVLVAGYSVLHHYFIGVGFPTYASGVVLISLYGGLAARVLLLKTPQTITTASSILILTLLFYSLTVLFSTIWSGVFEVVAMRDYLVLVPLFLMGLLAIARDKHPIDGLRALEIVVLLVVATGWLGTMGFEDFQRVYSNDLGQTQMRVVGILNNPNSLALFSLLSFSISWFRVLEGPRTGWVAFVGSIALLSIALYVILSTLSRAVLMGTFAVVILSFFLVRPSFLNTVFRIGLMLAGVVFLTGKYGGRIVARLLRSGLDHSTTARLDRWGELSEQLQGKEILGNGPGAFSVNHPWAVDSMYVKIVSEIGLLGLFAFILVFVTIAWLILAPSKSSRSRIETWLGVRVGNNEAYRRGLLSMFPTLGVISIVYTTQDIFPFNWIFAAFLLLMLVVILDKNR